MVGHDIIVIGASAGGVETLGKLAHDLSPNLPAAIFVVIHFPAYSKSFLPEILNRSSCLGAAHAKDGEAIQQGRIYVAPPDHHLLVKRGHIHLSRGPRENNHRPAIDTLFRSAALAYGPRVIGLVLTGSLDDGTAGLLALKQRGGIAVVQSPDEALFSDMPRSAIENVDVDYILPLSEIAAVLLSLAKAQVEEKADSQSTNMQIESDLAQMDVEVLQHNKRPGNPSAFACPDCGGVLWELEDGKFMRFRCRTGHSFTTKSLLASQHEALEGALWSALRALEEKSQLVHRMARRAQERGQNLISARFEAQVQDAKENIALIRQVLMNQEGEEEATSDPIDPAFDRIQESDSA
ncbi:chemotaxis protein CheB [Argonema galeatum]|uniref:chemotaxis protein CheB n=1 Tax=Argonema galeatum TaxID=2942762 RepID=UPI00201220B8|nr:chemotaxis protein CheB [Argonema galeatum]MCL1465063.1 chemotaxis protein CheB [Argonema galeatum A003/A1]